jgi:hypothetical protein
MTFPTLTHQRREGRPSLVATEAADKIVEALRRGSYIKPACVAAGVSYEALHNWILKGEADAEAGRDSEYARFRARLTRARAEGELKLVAKLKADPDWRVAAFLLERGYRERWGRAETQQTSVTITLTDKQLAALTEGLRYVHTRNVTPSIEAQVSNGRGETPPKR